MENQNQVNAVFYSNASKINHAWAIGNFFECMDVLSSKGYEHSSARDLARIRMQEGAYHKSCENGTIVSESFINLGSNSYLVRDPSSQIFLPGSVNLREEFFEDKTRSLLITPNNYVEFIGVQEIGNEPITNFLFEDLSMDYANFLKENGIERLPLFLNKRKGNSKLYLGPILAGSPINNFNIEDLASDIKLRGIPKNSQDSWKKIYGL